MRHPWLHRTRVTPLLSRLVGRGHDSRPCRLSGGGGGSESGSARERDIGKTIRDDGRCACRCDADAASGSARPPSRGYPRRDRTDVHTHLDHRDTGRDTESSETRARTAEIRARRAHVGLATGPGLPRAPPIARFPCRVQARCGDGSKPAASGTTARRTRRSSRRRVHFRAETKSQMRSRYESKYNKDMNLIVIRLI